MTMKPQQFFHDHPVIDEREDGTYLYFTPLPPILLKNPIILPDEDEDENQTPLSNNQDN